MSLISRYAATCHCPELEKETFYADLGGFSDKVPSGDEFLFVGDFNARLGIEELESTIGEGLWPGWH